MYYQVLVLNFIGLVACISNEVPCKLVNALCLLFESSIAEGLIEQVKLSKLTQTILRHQL
jgi:hypothetical protein